jgi:hypothetical protein
VGVLVNVTGVRLMVGEECVTVIVMLGVAVGIMGSGVRLRITNPRQ